MIIFLIKFLLMKNFHKSVKEFVTKKKKSKQPDWFANYDTRKIIYHRFRDMKW